MFCPNCGSNLKEGARFCSECGAEITSVQVIQTPPVIESAAPEIPVPENSAPPEKPVIPQPPAPSAAPVQNPNLQQRPAYTASNVPQSSPVSLDKPLSVWQYLGILILTSIPIVGIVMIFVWAFGNSVNKNKKNYSRAVLVMIVLSIILSVVISITLGSVITSFFKFYTSIPIE